MKVLTFFFKSEIKSREKMNFHEDKFPQMENAVALFCLTFFHYNITEVFSTGAAVQYHSWCENCMGLF